MIQDQGYVRFHFKIMKDSKYWFRELNVTFSFQYFLFTVGGKVSWTMCL